MKELVFNSAAALARMIQEKEISPVEVMTAHLQRIEQQNPQLNAIITLAAEEAMAGAKAAEAKLMKGEASGALFGLPFVIKDVFDTKGIRTTYGSEYFKNHIPKMDAFVVKKFKDAGGILLGKTNTPEFAFAHFTDNKLFGATKNPWDLTRSPGGSSGGDAAALASYMIPLTAGSDLGGSVRVPAHCCGVFGFRPTPGRVSIAGHSFVGSPIIGRMVSPGVMARTMEDIVLTYSALEGYNHLDPFSQDNLLNAAWPLEPIPELKCAVLPFDKMFDLNPEIHNALESAAKTLTENGGSWRSKRFVMEKEILPTVRQLTGIGLKNSLQRDLKGYQPPDGYTFLDDIHEDGTMADYMEAYRRNLGIIVMTNLLFMEFDLILMPVLPFIAPPSKDEQGNRLSLKYLFESALPNFLPVLAELPTLAVPMGLSKEGLPLGIQIVGAKGKDLLVLRAGACLAKQFQIDDSQLKS